MPPLPDELKNIKSIYENEAGQMFSIGSNGQGEHGCGNTTTLSSYITFMV